jgi:DNA-binding CsgD family transcriptional regulator
MSKRKFTNREERQIRRRYQAGESTVQIAAELGVVHTTISSILKRRGIKARSNSEAQGGLTPLQESEAIARYLDGMTTYEVGALLGVHGNTIGSILRRHNIERRGTDNLDNVRHILDGTGHHSKARKCSFYIVELANHPGYSKPGCSFNVKGRFAESQRQYGALTLCHLFETRAEAYCIEQAVLDQTRGSASCPDDLQGWKGATEVRAMTATDLSLIAQRLIVEMTELGFWDFAALRAPMTMAQRAICQQRALQGAPVVAAAATT